MIPVEAISGSSLSALLFYVSVLGLLLLVGVILRIKLTIFKKLFIPASLIAGFIGLLLGPYGFKAFPEEMVSTWGSLAGILITIVFAPMLIGLKWKTSKETSKLMVPHLLYSYAGSFSQLSIPLIVTSLILVPIWGVNHMFGSIIEVGWAGGHGTAAGMVEVYTSLGWESGASLGVTSATIGIVVGVISGIIMINHGVRRGYTSILKNPEELKANSEVDLIPKEKQTASASHTINSDVVEGFGFHAALIGIAVLIGWFIQQFLVQFVPGIPLFPLAMIGGIIVNIALSRTKFREAVDRKTFQRIQGVALDFLIVGAIASIQIPVVIEFAVPLILLSGLTLLMMIGYFYFLGPRLFKNNWFEHAIVHYGSYTGVAAVGLLLLRTADPEMKTDSGTAYALRAPFYSPILGGGLITSIVPTLIVSYGSLSVGLMFLGLLIVTLIVAKLLGFWHKPSKVQSHSAKSQSV